MAIVMEANYSKKLGLPGYSSHQYSVTLRTELSDLTQVDAESARLHTLLQTSVDREIQKVGFLPEKGNGNGGSNGNGHNQPATGNGHANGAQSSNGNREVWNCSPKQKQYIIDLVAGLELHHLVKLKTPKVIITPLGPMTDKQQARLFRSLESYVEGLARNDFVPSPGFHCAGCEVFAECRLWAGKDLHG